MTQTAYRAQLLTFRDDPAHAADGAVFEEDGLLIVEDGRVVAAGAYAALRARLAPDANIKTMRDKLIVPGFIDSHIHYPQTDMIASPAPGLLPWLNTYTFPTEREFGNPSHARETASFFLDELLACGTTTALVYCTVHKESADAFFTESESRNLRMVAGKVLMDRNCPEFLRDTAQSGYDDSAELIARWHNRGRQHYALTPRFAPTSTEAQLEACGVLARAHQDVFIQSHVAENTDEIKWVDEPVPGASQLSRHLRSLRPAAPSRGVRPLHLSRRRRPQADGAKRARWRRTARPRTCSSAAACSTSTRPAPRHAGRARDGRRRRHVVLDAADDERSAQDRAPDRPSFDRDAHVLALDDGRGEGARSRRQDRHARAGQRSRFRRARSGRHAASGAPHGAARDRSKNCCSRSRCSGMIARYSRLMRPAIACIGGARARRRRWNSPLKSAIDPARMRAPWKLNRRRNHPAIGGAVQPGRFFTRYVKTGRQGRARSLACR